MDILSISIPTLEKYAQLELKKILKKSSEAHDSAIIFETKSFADIAKFAYLSKTSSRVIILIDKRKVSELGKLKLSIPVDGEFKTFKVECLRQGKHSFTSHEIEEKIGGMIIKKFGYDVDLKMPDIVFFAYIYNDMIYLGIDICGFDLSKREYKIYNTPYSIKGPLGYIMVMMSGYDWKKNQVLLDTYSRTSEIVIEAACDLSQTSVHKYEKERFIFRKIPGFKNIDLEKLDENIELKETNINAYSENQKYIIQAKKNSKVLELNRAITFSRTDLDWIDIKFDKSTVDMIVTSIPKDANLKEFFHQAEFVLKKKAPVVLLVKQKISDDRFELTEEYKINDFYLIKLVKK